MSIPKQNITKWKMEEPVKKNSDASILDRYGLLGYLYQDAQNPIKELNP